MTAAIFSCVLFFSLASHESTSFRFDYKYIAAIKGYIKYHQVPASWRDARYWCDLEGARFAYPHDDVMLKTMLTVMKANYTRPSIFIGIHDLYDIGAYMTVDGTLISKVPAKRSQFPKDLNTVDNESCLVLNMEATLADVPCRDRYPFMCFKSQDEGNIHVYCDPTDPEYKLNEVRSKCYKLHREPQSWSRALVACSAEGASLLVINSAPEAAEVSAACSQVKIDNAFTRQYRLAAFVGVRHWRERGCGPRDTWRTIDGKTLLQAGYASWLPGQPDNAQSKEWSHAQECGAIDCEGRVGLVDTWCDAQLPFLCEKTTYVGYQPSSSLKNNQVQ